MILPGHFVRLALENVLAQFVRVFKEFVAIWTNVGFFWDVGGFRPIIGHGLLAADGMSFDHVHLVEGFGRETLRALVAFVFEFDERVHILVGLLEVTLKNNVVTEVDTACRAVERFRFDVFFFDVVLKSAESRESTVAFRTFCFVVVVVSRTSVKLRRKR